MNDKRKNADKRTISLRIVAGLYLLYTVYSMITDWEEVKASQKTFMTVMIILFAAAGIILLAIAIKGLIQLKHNQGNIEITEDDLEIGEINKSDIKTDEVKADEVNENEVK